MSSRRTTAVESGIYDNFFGRALLHLYVAYPSLLVGPITFGYRAVIRTPIIR